MSAAMSAAMSDAMSAASKRLVTLLEHPLGRRRADHVERLEREREEESNLWDMGGMGCDIWEKGVRS